MSLGRGFFGVGAQGISKGANLGTLVRSTHAFGGSFFFTIGAPLDPREVRVSDTSGAFEHIPFYDFANPADLMLPQGCQLVGIELTDDAIELPSFRHPSQAAYVLGPEMGHLSADLQERCDFIVKIPTKFCVNVGVAGAVVLYDRMISLGRFAERPVKSGGPIKGMPEPLWQPRKVV
jgi:tRNA G18 (ribose-2'-O)-methylase SpoU